MKCPHNEECTIEFESEECDNGDPSTPYFESYTVYYYNESTSQHVAECPGLTEAEITKLEDEYNNDPDIYWGEP